VQDWKFSPSKSLTGHSQTLPASPENMDNLDKITLEDLELFPDLSTYLSDLKKLQGYDFSNLTERGKYDVFYDYARILPTNIGWFNPEKFNLHKFYRVRLNIDREKEDISLAQTYSYPPPQYCFENGRANLKGRSVFYCSNDPRAAILECKPKVGDEGYLSIWNGVARRKIKIGHLLPFDLPPENTWNLMAQDSFEYLLKNLPSDAKDKFQHFIELYKFIAEIFITEKKPYNLTSMISEELIYGQLWRDFIIYPSVLVNSQLCNMAFHPNSVNENLKLEKVIEFKVTNINNNGPTFNLGKKVGFLENTKMTWKDRANEETGIFKKQ
jgi:RES domain